MKTMDEELKTMFGETPDSFRLAVQRAVDKKEAQPMKKRMTVRAILIAAVIIVATMAVAYAVGTGMGLTDFLGIFHENVQVPSGVKQVLDSTVQQHWQVGPLTLTLKQSIADGHFVCLVTSAAPTDGTQAVCITNSAEADYPFEDSHRVERTWGMAADATPQQVAREKGLKLYRVSARMDGLECSEIEMEACIYDDDGMLNYVDQAITRPAEVGEELRLDMFLRVEELDVDTLEVKQGCDWSLTPMPEVVVPVQKAIATRTYVPQEEGKIGSFTLNKVVAEQMQTGVYVTAYLTMDDANARPDELYNNETLVYTDMQGNPFPGGMSLSGNFNMDHLPQVEETDMLGLDSLPEEMLLCGIPLK